MSELAKVIDLRTGKPQQPVIVEQPTCLIGRIVRAFGRLKALDDAY